jgi:hypothetical protein
MNFGDAIGYLKLDASMSQERAIEIVKEHEWMRDLDIPNFVPYPSSRQVWETAKRQVEGGKFFTACVLRMVEEGKCAMERKSHMDRVAPEDQPITLHGYRRDGVRVAGKYMGHVI